MAENYCGFSIRYADCKDKLKRQICNHHKFTSHLYFKNISLRPESMKEIENLLSYYNTLHRDIQTLHFS